MCFLHGWVLSLLLTTADYYTGYLNKFMAQSYKKSVADSSSLACSLHVFSTVYSILPQSIGGDVSS